LIKHQFFYNDQEIMRIYHDGFDDYPIHRTIYQEEKLSSGTIVLKECWIDTFDSKERKGLDYVIWCAHKFIDDEPFAVLPDDDIFQSEKPCPR